MLHDAATNQKPLFQCNEELLATLTHRSYDFPPQRNFLGREKTMYHHTWKSIDSRPVPEWFDEAKFGIFIHWGIYSVPSWSPKRTYAEWYWYNLVEKNDETRAFHERVYGKSFKYQDFVKDFKAELFDPDRWAGVFKGSGARYVVLTSKHHDGYCLWPSPHSWNWNSVDTGPHRDLVGDLAQSVREAGLKMGLYYSLYEWYHPFYRENPAKYVEKHMIPQFKELVLRYSPSLIFTDGEWDHPSEVWRSTEILAWLLNEGPNPAEVVFNDRWGKETRNEHGGYYTTEYGDVGEGKAQDTKRKWEECRGIGHSFGYSRNEDLDDYASAEQLIHLLVDLVSKGGNLLLNVGPTADGRIPVIQQQRLDELGKWLSVNGEAIYGTKPWRQSAEGDLVRYTAKGDAVYAICLKWPGKELVLTAPKPLGNVRATLLGHGASLGSEHRDGRLHIQVPALSVDELPCHCAFVVRLEGVD